MIGTDMGDIERQDLQGIGIGFEADLFIFGKYIVPNGDAHRVSGVVDGEIGDTDDHNLGRQGYGFLPMRELEMVGEGAFFLEGTIRYDGIVIGGGDAPIEGGFIGWVVYARQPVMGPIGPVIAEEPAMAVFVVGNDEGVCRHAVVADSIVMLGGGDRAGLEGEVGAVLLEGDRLVILGNGKNGHSFAGAVPCGEIEAELSGVGAEKDGNDRGTADTVAVIIEREGEVIVLNVDDRVV